MSEPSRPMKPGHQGLKHVSHAFVYTVRGLDAAWRNESAFRQECVLALLLLPCAFLLGESLAQTALLVAVLVLVLITELLNSAIEAVVDRISTEHSELSGQAKDMGSAAVALSLLLVPLTWGLVAAQRFLAG
ncbi:MAG: diacylglycerol kinase [Pseudomonadales bacterium]